MPTLVKLFDCASRAPPSCGDVSSEIFDKKLNVTVCQADALSLYCNSCPLVGPDALTSLKSFRLVTPVTVSLTHCDVPLSYRRYWLSAAEVMVTSDNPSSVELPPATVLNESAPVPFVVSTCPFVPSEFGRVYVLLILTLPDPSGFNMISALEPDAVTMALPFTSNGPPSCGVVSSERLLIPLVIVEASVIVLASVHLKFAPPVTVSAEILYVVLLSAGISDVNAMVPVPPGTV